ncbi:MAG: DUF4446 family protein [Candidatus Moranbacteria bacterium]|nr:DUF4446 family protein [Candidatus Moranbacteria bacterium]
MKELLEPYTFIILIAIVSFFAISVILGIVVLLKVKKLEKKSKHFFSGKNGGDLEELLNKNIENIHKMDDDIQELFKASNEIYDLSFSGIHKIGLVRFNPFKDLGGDQSFSIALLNGDNSGIVISSLHTREGTRIYSKSIKNSKSEKYTLTAEEEESIEKAKNIPKKEEKKGK